MMRPPIFPPSKQSSLSSSFPLLLHGVQWKCGRCREALGVQLADAEAALQAMLRGEAEA